MIKVQLNINFRIFGIFLIASFSLLPGVFSQETTENEYLKKYYSVDDGLSQSEVTSIIQDKYGFIWLGTRGGLNRFDGYDFTHFKPQPGDARGLSNPSIETLHSDQKGNIWIGTKSGGLGIYSILKDEFIDIDSLSQKLPNRIISFYEDREGHFWIGSWNAGVYRYHPKTGDLTRYLETARVSSIIQTQDGTMWFGSESGLRYKKPDSEEIFFYTLKPGFYEVTAMLESPQDSSLWMVGWNVGLTKFNYASFSKVVYDFEGEDSQQMNCHSLLQDSKGHLWVGTWSNGLYCRHKGSGVFKKVLPGKGSSGFDRRELNIILDLFEDRAGGIWVGADGGGVVRLSSDRKFNTVLAGNKDNIGPWHINTVEVSSKGQLWVGTRSSGLYVSDDRVTFDFVDLEIGHPLYGSNRFMVKSVDEDDEGILWVGLEAGLFVVAESKTGELELVNAAKVFESADLGVIRKVLDVKKKGNDLWIATQQNGLYWFERQDGKYLLKSRFYAGDLTNTFQDNRISCLQFDHDGHLWIGTYKGLYRKRLEDAIPVPAHRFITNNQRFLCDIILSCEVDARNRIWVGTPCSLNGLTPDGKGAYFLKEYTHEQGITDDYINAIAASGEFVWVSTNAGISRFDPELEVFSNFDISDGVGDHNFAESSSAIDHNGLIYFGGYTDLTYFNPAGLEERTMKPPIVITDFRVMNQQVSVSADGLLPVSVNEIESIRLNYKQKEFSFELAALDYKSPENNQYAYRLADRNGEGEWVYIGQRRHVSFNNLKSGDYTLQLAGSNSNGVWNRSGRSIEITILPAPWETWYAFVIYLLVLLGIVHLINRVSLSQERLKNMARIEHVKRMQEHQLNEYKISFFTDISHELKTPLTLIQGPIEEFRSRELSSMSPTFFQKRVELIHSSVTKLLGLLNQLLEFRKVEAGHAILSASKSDVVSFVSSVCSAYKNVAKSQGIDFICDFKMKKALIWFEPAKLDIVLNNLLSNAFKYCGKPGKVRLLLAESANEVLLSVSNNGKSIAEKDLDKLFDKFYQAPGRSRQSGYGIGLFLVRKFMELHKSTVNVESIPGEMTIFTIKLLKGDEHLMQEEKVGDEHIDFSEAPKSRLAQPAAEFKSHKPKANKNAKILVVEDNPEVASYIMDILENQYEVIVAEDGLAGYDSVMALMPDLVVSDVMMPRSDGYELCARLKKNELTAHIPVILLTAKDTADDQLVGARKGADAFLAKPFNPALLFETVKQLIASRLALAEKYKRVLSLDPVNKEITSDDEILIKRVIRIIEKHAENPKLDSDFVAAETGMSISTFYRRMKKAVDQTPGEFIKTTRLKLAARYLKETNLTVSEIVEKIGYSDIRNFRKSFQIEYGLSPSDYRKAASV